MHRTGSPFCVHLTERILACAEKHGVPIVKNCFTGENSFADRLATGDPKEHDTRLCDGAFADVEFAQHRSPLMLFANRIRLERARELRGMRGKVRAGRAHRLSLREEIKHHQKGRDPQLPSTEMVARLGHMDAARIFAIASTHLHTCGFCMQVHTLMIRGEFWKWPGAPAGEDDVADEMVHAMVVRERDCVIIMQDVSSRTQQFLVGLCDQTMWKLAVILSQFGVLPFQHRPRSLQSTAPSGSFTGEATWNVAMVITLPHQSSLNLQRMLHALHSATGIDDIRQRLLRHDKAFASATVYLNRGVQALQSSSPFVDEQKCPDAIRILSPICT